MNEILKGADFNSLDKEIQDNLLILLEKINKIRTLYNKSLTVTSGLRARADQIRIYEERAKKAGVPFDLSKVPFGSAHIKGAAIDIYDPNKDLQKWTLANIDKLEEIGLWCEDFSATVNWVHYQTYAPKSGKRFFNP